MREYEQLGEPSVTLDDIKQLPPARQQGAGPSGISLGLRRRDHHRPAGPGHRHQRRHGHRAEVAGRPLQPAGLRDLRLQHLRRLRRRLHDGRHRLGGGVARRASAASTTSAGSTTTTTSPSKATRASPSPRTSPPASWATAGTYCASATPTTSSASSTRLDVFQQRPRIGRLSSSSTATSATARRTSRTRPRPTASRSARRRSG